MRKIIKNIKNKNKKVFHKQQIQLVLILQIKLVLLQTQI